MTAPLTWSEVAIRLALTILAGLLIGYNRREQGKAAGMRTTLLVGLAASLSMLQMNALLSMAGRPITSFVMNDLMRLPLGILTGVGFIGAGVIMRRGSMVVGVTTAATMWLVTVIGLCLGGGQLALGMLGTLIGFAALWLLPWFEERLRQRQRGRLWLEVQPGGPGEADIRQRLMQAGMLIDKSALKLDVASQHTEYEFEVQQLLDHARASDTPAVVARLASERGIVRISWNGPV